jgi:hypothetical protein
MYIKNKSTNKKSYKNKSNKNKTTNKGRTSGGKVPQGRTLTTKDGYLDKHAKEPNKERPVVVIETNDCNDLAVVQLTTRDGKDRTHLRNYQQGQSYFKHYVEIEDDTGKPIRVNEKFRENNPKMDVSDVDVEKIRKVVFQHSKQMQNNKKLINKFRSKK